MDAETLRRAFTEFFVERGHTAVASAGLIPHHPTAPLLTNAGMNQFIPYFVGEEPPPWPRATTVQKCFRTQDIDIVGTTTRHLTFFEMLGNFSFGDYFKPEAIAFAWELVTKVLGLDPDRLWATVHLTDDEAERVWVDEVGLPADRVQRLDEDNWWAPGKKTDPGPCGPCSEIYFDKGEEHGEPGGPAGGGAERYVEIWNLVFMQYNRQADGSLVDLPRKNIDTGAGFERILPILQGTNSVFDTDVLRPMVAAAEAATGRTYGAGEESVDVSLRILADHARAMTFLVNDGVLPSNEARGYVLRRIIRRAVRHAFQLGVEGTVTPALVQATVATMAGAYPELTRNADFVTGVVVREEERFRRTLEAGMGLLEHELGFQAVADAARETKAGKNNGSPASGEAPAGTAGRPPDSDETMAGTAGRPPDSDETMAGTAGRPPDSDETMAGTAGGLAGSGDVTPGGAGESAEFADATTGADKAPAATRVVSGEVAFKLHDTFGFPIELTSEIAAERGLEVDIAGFETAMAAQRRRARQATAGRTEGAANAEAYRELLEQFGTTEFTGYAEYESKARVLAVLPGATAGGEAGGSPRTGSAGITAHPIAEDDRDTPVPGASEATGPEGGHHGGGGGSSSGGATMVAAPEPAAEKPATEKPATEATAPEPAAEKPATVTVEIFLDRTPFYAEGGGQVGDTGFVVTETGRAEILDTTAPVPGLHRHTARIVEGAITAGQEAVATIDAERRDAIRRNHTGTHLLHWALREVVGTHVKQQGSLVAPEYLRFDFSNDGPVPAEQLQKVEELVNGRILANEPVRAYETSKAHAEELGAIAFFGDKYGDFVRVVESGSRSLELCGGTHVHALGMIGPVKITSEASIGANMRRVFALTGTATLARVREEEQVLERAAQLLRAEPMDVPGAVERLLERQRATEAKLKSLRSKAAGDEARTLAATATPAGAFAKAPGAGAGVGIENARATKAPPAGAGAEATEAAPAGPGAEATEAAPAGAGAEATEAAPAGAGADNAGAERGPASAGPLCVVARRDGLPQDQMRDLAIAIRREPHVQGVVLIGSPDGQRVALVAAVEPNSGLDAPALVSAPARLLGGGGGGRGDVAVAGGKDPTKIDEALLAVRATLGLDDA